MQRKRTMTCHKRFHVALLAIAVAATAAGCADVEDDEELGEIASDLSVTGWSPRVSLGAASAFGSTPGTVNGTTVIVRGNLAWAKRTANGWTPWLSVGQSSSLRPSLAGFNGFIYMLRMGSHHDVYMARFDPSTDTWSQGWLLPYQSDEMPAIVAFQSRLWILGNTPGTYQMWSATMTADEVFSQSRLTDGKYTVGRPSAAVYANRLYVAHQQASSDKIIYAQFDGTTWTANQFIFAGQGGAAISGFDPQIAAVNGFLHIVYQDPHVVPIKWSYFDTCVWSPEVSIGTSTTAAGYGLAQGGPGLVLTTRTTPSSTVWVSEFTAPPPPLRPPFCGVVNP
jgi:hypothetical protein